jgi:hypothetical protein
MTKIGRQVKYYSRQLGTDVYLSSLLSLEWIFYPVKEYIQHLSYCCYYFLTIVFCNYIFRDDFASENWSIEPTLFFPSQYFSK